MTLSTQQVDLGGGTLSSLNITSATVVATGRGTLAKVYVNVGSTATQAVYDSTSTAGNSAANQILTIPANKVAGTMYTFPFPFFQGLIVAPGAGGALNVAYIGAVT